MKTLAIIFLTVISPLFAMTQEYYFQAIKLKTLDQRNVEIKDIFQGEYHTIVFFFNENSRNLTDQFDYLENLVEKYDDIKLKVYAVYNASNGSYSQVKPLIHGYDIDLETFIDVNGEMQRALGLPVNSTMILSRYADDLSGRNVESVSYSPEQADMELMTLLSGDYCTSDHDQYLSHNIVK